MSAVCEGASAGYLASFGPKRALSARDPDGSSGLHMAAGRGDRALVEYFIGCGVPVDLADGKGFTPLMKAAICGRDEACAMLLAAGADAGLQMCSGLGALELAERFGKSGCAGAIRAALEAKELGCRAAKGGRGPKPAGI